MTEPHETPDATPDEAPEQDHPPDDERRTAAEEATRKRQRAKVFGDVLPDGTTDERDDTWGDRDPGSEEWLRRQVPPHHG